MAQRNEAFVAWMEREGWSAPALAKELDAAVRRLTQRTGPGRGLSEITVHKWRSAETRWPQQRYRIALEQVSGLPVTALGFVPRRKPAPDPALSEDPDMHRRTLFGAAAGTAAAALPLAALAPSRPSRVGTADVIRLRDGVERLIAQDADRGGHGLDQAALSGAAEALRLQKESAPQRIRRRLYALASDFTSTAAWSLIDAGRLDGAGVHLDRALALAGLAQDSERLMQAWNLRAMLARQRRDYAEAVAAAQAAQATAVTRRSPLHASLAHARIAVGLAHSGDRRGALAALGRAQHWLSRADLAQPVASWIAFYGPAELHSLSAIVHDVVGDAAEAEAASYRSLACLPENFRRNRAYTTVRLALAQLHQGDAEQAHATSTNVFAIMAGTPLPGRMRLLLGDFQRDLLALSPALAHTWADQHRTQWSSS
ncbi:XRE family transcriptional regulator [Streptomyces sp. NPDC058495]|uniref:XRE family transcriptional regulator n=1 Tax=unclassified Streptomyces TaxID=2593676 RepID=UPI003662E4F5